MQPPALTARRRRLLAFSSALVVVGLGLAVGGALDGLAGSRARVAHTREVAGTLAHVVQRLADAETGQRGFIITGDPAYLSPYAGAADDIRAGLARLRTLTTGDPRQRFRLDTLERLTSARLAVLDGRITVRRRAGFDSARVAIVQGGGRELMEQARQVAARIEVAEQTRLEDRVAAEAAAARRALVVLAAGTALAAIIAVLLNDLLARLALAQEQAARELEERNARLQEQAVELEMQQQQLQEQAQELEMQTTQLQDQTAELELANEELHATMTALEERSDAAERAQRAADLANRAKSDFLATMSHELRTPLNAIAGYVELLEMGLRGPVTPAQLEDLRRIRKSEQVLLALVNDVLNFARLEAGRVHFQIAPMPLAGLVAELEPLVAPQVRAAGLTYEASVAGGLVAMADPEKVRQIVLNLLTNAIKFTPAGGRIGVQCEGMREEVEIRVTDTGRGIPAEMLERIFEPFVQVEHRLNLSSQQGVGLGLAISRDLARGMDGELTARSEVGVGSTFTLRLRRAEDLLRAPEQALRPSRVAPPVPGLP